MISVDKNHCCGCSSCAQRCPQQCIVMKVDEYGFLYPKADPDKCIGCGLCEEVCPSLRHGEPKDPLLIETAINPDCSVRRQSSSGGVFTMLAEYVLNEGGVVFGARFNEQWDVVVDYTESNDGLSAFRGSKYVQAVVGNAYQKTEEYLHKGRKVLFSGTPCQISGLRLFLRKEYENLLTVAIACHSVPSPLVWSEYLKGLKLRDISDIQFRDKRISWERYGLTIIHGNGKEFFQQYGDNPYMQLFLHGITIRPSCFNCPAKNGRSRADIVIGDCWGVSKMLPDYDNDHLGISLVICQTGKGAAAAEVAGIKGFQLQYYQVVANNGGLTTNARVPAERNAFWCSFLEEDNKGSVIKQFAHHYIPGLGGKLKQFIKRLIYK